MRSPAPRTQALRGTPMARAAAAILLCVGVVACASGEATAPTGEFPGIAGTWTLRSIGRFNFSQQQLPFTDGDEIFVAGVIVVNDDGTFSQQTTTQTTVNGPPTTETLAGTWTLVDSGLYRFRFPHMEADDFVSTEAFGTTLKYHNIPQTWVFTRDIPSGLPNQGTLQPFRGCAFVSPASRPSTAQGVLDDGDCKLASSGFYANHKVDYYELRLGSPATFIIEETSNGFDADWMVFDRATGGQLWFVSVKDVPEVAWRRITLGAGAYVVAAISEFQGQSGSYTLKIE